MAQESLREKVKELCRILWKDGCMLSDVISEVEKQFIVNVLNDNKGNGCRAARELGVHRNTLSRKLSSLKLVRVKGCRNIWYATEVEAAEIAERLKRKPA